MNQESKPLDLHELAQFREEGGYEHAIMLSPCSVQTMARRLHAITAVARVLAVETDVEAITLGNWMRGGLIDAISALARDASADLEQMNEHARKELQ